MRRAVLMLALVGGLAHAAPSDLEAQEAHAKGQCGSIGPGTGLGPDGKGWIVSMLPGPHEFRVLSGSVGVTVLQQTAVDLDAGRPTYIAVSDPVVARTCSEQALRGSVCLVQWRSAGWDWGPISRLFLYPPERRKSKP